MAEQKSIMDFEADDSQEDVPYHEKPIIDHGLPEDAQYFCQYCFGRPEDHDNYEDCIYKSKSSFIKHMEIVHDETVIKADSDGVIN